MLLIILLGLLKLKTKQLITILKPPLWAHLFSPHLQPSITPVLLQNFNLLSGLDVPALSNTEFLYFFSVELREF